jgi:hypothetical protein
MNGDSAQDCAILPQAVSGRRWSLHFFMPQCSIHLMFVVVVRARSEPMALAATLGPLVRGVIEGLVGSAYLIAEAETPDLGEIADSAGCRILTAPTWPEGFARAVVNTAGAPLLVIDTGLLLGQDFWPTIADRMPLLGDRPAATEPADGAPLAARIKRRIAAMRGQVDEASALLLPGSLARNIGQSKGDPWRWPYGESLIRLPVKGSRVT